MCDKRKSTHCRLDCSEAVPRLQLPQSYQKHLDSEANIQFSFKGATKIKEVFLNILDYQSNKITIDQKETLDRECSEFILFCFDQLSLRYVLSLA